jgi:hypothetical protein
MGAALAGSLLMVLSVELLFREEKAAGPVDGVPAAVIGGWVDGVATGGICPADGRPDSERGVLAQPVKRMASATVHKLRVKR